MSHTQCTDQESKLSLGGKTKSYRRAEIFFWLALAIAALALLVPLYLADAREVKARKAAVIAFGPKFDQVAAEVENRFRAWTRTTVTNGEVFDWTGKDATLIWVERQSHPAYLTGSYTFWAMTPAKRYFRVKFEIDADGRVNPSTGFQEMQADAFVRSLIDAGQSDLINKMGLVRSPA